MPLASFLVRRLIAALALVAVVSTGALVLVRLSPGDAASIVVAGGGNHPAIERTRTQTGLDQPIARQLGSWVRGLAHFDLGRSSSKDLQPVGPLAFTCALNTARLAATALFLATIVGLPLGMLTGARPRGLLATIVTPVSIALVSCPPIVGALVLLFVALTTKLVSMAPGSLTVPALALALPLAASLERLQSQATADALAAPDLLAAAARGLTPARLLWRHAGRQSLRPVLAVYGVIIGGLFSGSLAVEVVTGWPGLGRLTAEAVAARDVYLAAGCALVGAIVLAAGNLAADVVRVAVDPRLRERG